MTDEPVYALFHQFLLGIPGVGPLLKRAGAIDAGPAHAEAILSGEGILIDYPGGDYEVFRPWWERNRIEFGDRRGFVRLALRTQVPIVPAVSVGSHETLVVLSSRTTRRQPASGSTGYSGSKSCHLCSGPLSGSFREGSRPGHFQRRSP